MKDYSAITTGLENALGFRSPCRFAQRVSQDLPPILPHSGHAENAGYRSGVAALAPLYL